jgi:hypothetical protein
MLRVSGTQRSTLYITFLWISSYLSHRITIDYSSFLENWVTSMILDCYVEIFNNAFGLSSYLTENEQSFSDIVTSYSEIHIVINVRRSSHEVCCFVRLNRNWNMLTKFDTKFPACHMTTVVPVEVAPLRVNTLEQTLTLFRMKHWKFCCL